MSHEILLETILYSVTISNVISKLTSESCNTFDTTIFMSRVYHK